MTSRLGRWLLGLALAALAVGCLFGVSPAQEYIELDPIVVEGEIQRPEAAYIIQRAQLDFGIAAKRRSFIQKVSSSIDEPPF